MNCRVLRCSGQGFLGDSDYGEIAYNYVDYIGGGLLDSNGTMLRSGFDHAIYFSGVGTSIHDNFFGRSLSGFSGQIIPKDGGPPITIANNVFYGSCGDGMTLYAGDNAVITGNVFTSHPVVWYGVEQGYTGTGMRIFFTSPNAVVSGNYVEGAVAGLVFLSAQPDPRTQAETGIEIVGNTLVGGYSPGQIDGVPGVMNDNHWAGATTLMTLFWSGAYFVDYLAWAKALGLETQSTWTSATLINPFPYDALLDGSPSLASAMSALRQYADNQVNAIAGSPSGTPTTIGGTSTPDAAGATPVANNAAYQVSAGGTLAGSVLASGSGLTADWFSGPAHGQLSLNSDGTFTYTPSPGFYGADQFVYRVYDSTGGMAQATVTVNVSGALAAANDSYSLSSTSKLTVLAPGVLANDSLPGGASVSISAGQTQHGTLLVRSDGSFDYTPQAGFVGVDTFSYTITDGGGDSASGTVTLTVQPAAAGVVTGPAGDDLFRIWQSAGDPATINALSSSGGSVLVYSVARAAVGQWAVSGGAGQDILEIDYSNGDPLPSGGASYDAGPFTDTGKWLDGNVLFLLGVGPQQEVHADAGQLTVGNGEPVAYTNVQLRGVNFAFSGYADWDWWPGLTLSYGGGTLAVSDTSAYQGDLAATAGTMRIDGPISPQYLDVGTTSQLAGAGAVTFTAAAPTADTPAGLYYSSTASSTFGGSLGGPGLVEVDDGSLALTGANSYTAGTSVNGGSLTVAGPGSLPGYAVSGSVTVAAGTTLTAQAGSGQWDAPSLQALLATTAFASGSTLGLEVNGTSTFTYEGDLAGGRRRRTSPSSAAAR